MHAVVCAADKAFKNSLEVSYEVARELGYVALYAHWMYRMTAEARYFILNLAIVIQSYAEASLSRHYSLCMYVYGQQ